MLTEIITTNKDECMLSLFVALAHNRIECINDGDGEKYNLTYNEKHLIIYNVYHRPITSAKMTTIGYNAYRITIDEDLLDEVTIDIYDDYMYCYKEGFPTAEEMEYLKCCNIHDYNM